jgi:hypothetical protein
MSVSLCCDRFHLYFLIFLKQTNVTNFTTTTNPIESSSGFEVAAYSQGLYLHGDSLVQRQFFVCFHCPLGWQEIDLHYV